MYRSNERDVPLRSEACFGDKWCFCSSCEAGTVVLLSSEIYLSAKGSAEYEHELTTMKHTWKARPREEALPVKEVDSEVVDEGYYFFPLTSIDLNASLDTWLNSRYLTDTKKD